VVVAQGEVWWADLGEPLGSVPGFRRPVLVVQGDPLNRSALATLVCVPLTSQLRWASAAGNVELTSRETGLGKPSVANVSQLVTLDRAVLDDRAGKIPRPRLEAVLNGIDVVLGRRPA
jgi:mRNA interferase MazF